MKRPLLAKLAIGLPLFALGGFVAMPAAAQSASESVNQLIVYGDDPCPQSSGEEIVVCARRPEGERYRIPAALRESSDPANESWAARAQSFEMVGDFGILSCSPAGLGGSFGCTERLIEQAYRERENSTDTRFTQLIEAERERRLSAIDEEAARQQAAVEALEREYQERLEAERDAEIAPDGTTTSPATDNSLALPPED